MPHPRVAVQQTVACAAAFTALSISMWCNTPSHADVRSKNIQPEAAVPFPVGKGTAPYWTTRQTVCTSPPATRSTPADFARVVVIGAGMSGSSAAMHLAQQGVSVMLMDARGVSEGATGRNGGFLFPPALAMLILAAVSGKGVDHFRKSAEILFFERDNRAAIRDFVRSRGVACELDHNIDVFQVFDSGDELRAKVGGLLWPLRGLAGLVGVSVLATRSELGEALSLPVVGPWQSGLRLSGAADTFCAADVAKHCVVDAVAAGADWLPGTCAVSLEEAADGSGVTVVTDSGVRVRCEKVIVATNAYVPTLIPSLSKYITPVRNHVGVTSPAPPLNRTKSGARCGISCEDGFVYLHQRPDGRVVVGGFRNQETGKGVGEADDSCVVDNVAHAVKTFIPLRFALGSGANVTVDKVWTGVIGWSCDDLPWVGPVPEHPAVLVCGGFSGHGLTQTFLCGKAVAAMALGQKPAIFVSRFLPSFDRRNTANLVAGHPDPQ